MTYYGDADEMLQKAGERRRAEIALEDTPGGEKLLKRIDGYKDEIKKTRGLTVGSDEGVLSEEEWIERNKLTDPNADMGTYEEYVESTPDKKRANNPYSKENRKKRRQIYKEYNALAREVASMGAGLKVINELQASGDFDAIATNADGIEMAEAFLDMGYYISFSGNLTFKNSHLPEVAKEIPLDKVLVETDSPYLSPEPHRGKSNEPGRTRFVAEKLAGIFDLSFESMAKKTNNNSSEIFQLP